MPETPKRLTAAPDPLAHVWDVEGHHGRVSLYDLDARAGIQHGGIVAVRWDDGITSWASWRHELFDGPPPPKAN